MLSRVQASLLRANMLGMVPKRAVSQAPGKTYFVPNGGEEFTDVIQHLDKLRPTFTLVYFTAKWNPMCARIEQDYENLTAQYAHYHHIRVDCDQAPMVKRFFDARVEPQFLVLVNGGEIERITGFNFDKIGKQLQRITELHYGDMGYFGNGAKQWERFYDFHDKFAKSCIERDPFVIRVDHGGDQWRGPGTANP